MSPDHGRRAAKLVPSYIVNSKGFIDLRKARQWILECFLGDDDAPEEPWCYNGEEPDGNTQARYAAGPSSPSPPA